MPKCAAQEEAAPASGANATQLIESARRAFVEGRKEDAVGFLKQAEALAPDSPQIHFAMGQMHAALRDFEKAIHEFTRTIDRAPKHAQAYQQRGVAHFMNADPRKSINDFDAYLAFHPEQKPHHWQRGISYYYAGEFQNGVEQFESHLTVNPADVENSFFHFICVAQLEGLEAAREKLLPVGRDTRVPMTELYDLLSGKGNELQVMNAAHRDTKSPQELRNRLLYAHLYLGLYHEVLGNKKESAAHIAKAAGEYFIPHYMGDVARVHQILRSGDERSRDEADGSN